MAQEIAIAVLAAIIVALLVLRRKASGKVEDLTEDNMNLRAELKVARGLVDGMEGKYKDMADSVFREQNESFKMEATGPVIRVVDALKASMEGMQRNSEAQRAEFNANMKNMSSINSEMMSRTSAISDVLKNPQKRGRHAEIGLERIFEMSNLTKGIHYTTQRVTEGGQRPDFVVRLSEDRVIVIDSKAPLDSLLEAFDTDDDAEKAEALDRHVMAVRQHITTLARRRYSEKVGSMLEYVIMVVPEYALLPALERQAGLVEFALKNNVILVTHSTLMVLLRTVDLMWKQSEMADRVRNIGKITIDMYERICVFASHYANTGKGLEDAIRHYNDGVGSWTSRLLPKARELAEIGHTAREMPDVRPVDHARRALPEDDSK